MATAYTRIDGAAPVSCHSRMASCWPLNCFVLVDVESLRYDVLHVPGILLLLSCVRYYLEPARVLQYWVPMRHLPYRSPLCLPLQAGTQLLCRVSLCFRCHTCVVFAKKRARVSAYCCTIVEKLYFYSLRIAPWKLHPSLISSI